MNDYKDTSWEEIVDDNCNGCPVQDKCSYVMGFNYDPPCVVYDTPHEALKELE